MLMAIMINGIQADEAAALTANEVLNKMSVDERAGYFSGVVDGLAQARWIRDKPDQTGMKCIQDWYYTGGEPNHKRIYAWLNKHSGKPANALLYVLIKKECGA